MFDGGKHMSKDKSTRKLGQCIDFPMNIGWKGRCKGKKCMRYIISVIHVSLYYAVCTVIQIRQMGRLNKLVLVLIIISSALAVTKISHKAQLGHCLGICHQHVTKCINLRHKKCLNTYHTCLTKAKDFYRCANSSQIKQMKSLAKCIQN